jgi:hypothetical protein
MSVIAAIDVAVRLQLARDNVENYNDYRRVMGARIPAVGANPEILGLGLDQDRMEIFLQKVSRRLKFDTPPLEYDWTRTSAARALTADRETLIEMIAVATAETPKSAKGE